MVDNKTSETSGEVWEIRHDAVCVKVNEHEERITALEKVKAERDVTFALFSKDLHYMRETLDEMKVTLNQIASEPGANVSVFKRAIITSFTTVVIGGMFAGILWAMSQMGS